MNIINTELPGVLIVKPAVFRDNRGHFFETYHGAKFREQGIVDTFVQENQSKSNGGTIRGLHLQLGAHEQAKLVRVLDGEIYDVCVDVRRGSPTFGKWVGVTLSAENFLQCYVPAGFAHGFAVLSPTAEVAYKCSSFYEPSSELGIKWDDPAIGIKWPIENPTMSDRDKQHPALASLTDRLPLYRP